MFTAASRVSILKWWWAINSLNALRLRMVRCVPSFFGRKNIVELLCFLCRRNNDPFSEKFINFSHDNWMLVTVDNSSNNLKNSRVSRYRSPLRQKMFELSRLKTGCDFTKLCTMAIGKVVMFALHTSGTFIVAGSFRRPFSFSAALRSGFCLKNQRIFL